MKSYLGQFQLRHSDLDGDELRLSAETAGTVYSSLWWSRAGRVGAQATAG
ncbi:MAG TPA: hypothetical protein VN306_03850 [Mycobacterium sp.]|nr:hypothetical protein [Mycobacterium sp.]